MAVDHCNSGTPRIPRRVSLLLSLSFVLVWLAMSVISGGCRNPQASHNESGGNERASATDLKLTADQVAFIDSDTPKVIAWQTYWTWPDANTDPLYSANAGKRVSAKYISLECAVIVWINELKHASVLYVKMPDGRLEYPGFVGWTEGKDDLEGLIRGAHNSTNWDLFLLKLDDSSSDDLRLARRKGKEYHRQFQTSTRYWSMDGEITLPPLGPPPYEPTSDTKQLLLEKTIAEVVRQCDKMYQSSETLIITIPNFNVGDPTIWVLVQPSSGGGIVMGIQLCTNPKDEPVIFGSVVSWDITVERYGVKDDTVDKIRARTLKIVRHKIARASG